MIMNKYQKALDSLKLECKATYIDDRGVRIYTSDKNADERVRILQELVDKETPKSVEKDWVIDDGVEREIPICPVCKNIYLTRMQNYCDCCGQKINTKEVKE